MVDMLKSARDEDQRKRDEAQFYSIHQQLDELRRQQKENLARQQWFEELYKQNEGKVTKLELAQDRLTHDVAQALHVRQIDEGRVKAQLSELAQRVEAPDKMFRELRAQIQELNEARKHDRESDNGSQAQMEDLRRQIREINAYITQVSDSQKQLRDLLHELDSKVGEVRQEALHLGEMQTVEEQRLRRQGVELQSMFEALRQQFTEIASRSQRVDDVRRQLSERLDLLDEQMIEVRTNESTGELDLERIEKQMNEQYINQQERLETMRTQLEAQLGEMRQLGDQRTDRYMSRFTDIDERIRMTEQALSELPSRFEALEHKDELLGSEADTIEEWLVMRQIEALQGVLEDVRKRRTERSGTLKVKPRVKPEAAPGSVYNPAGLLKSVRDARPPSRPRADAGDAGTSDD